MYILYGGQFTRALIVEMVLAEGRLDYELREIDIVNQEHRAPEYLAVNPAGWVPALITPGGETLYETPAISLYLAEHHGLAHLAPKIDEAERGQFLSGLFYLTDELEPVMKRYFYPHRYVMREEDAPARKQQSIRDAMVCLSVIDQRLATGGPFHLGERFSLVDLMTAYWAAYLDTGKALDPYPALRRCIELVRQRPVLRDKFETWETMRAEYAALQAKGGGVR